MARRQGSWQRYRGGLGALNASADVTSGLTRGTAALVGMGLALLALPLLAGSALTRAGVRRARLTSSERPARKPLTNVQRIVGASICVAIIVIAIIGNLTNV